MSKPSNLPILIVGAGPAGLGAAWKLDQSGCDDWLLYERGPGVGGLSGTIVDERGFTWDIGGHLLFSHYDLFTRLVDELMPAGEWVEARGSNVVRVAGRWLPHPIQRCLQNLPAPLAADCLDGIIRAAMRRLGNRSEADIGTAGAGPGRYTTAGAGPGRYTTAGAGPGRYSATDSLDDLVVRNYGEGLADLFMRPFNRKLWACEPSELDAGCYAEHIAPIDPVRAMRHVLQTPPSEPKLSTLRFPRSGGTGTLWNALAQRLPREKLTFDAALVAVDVDRRIAHFSNGDEVRYGSMISTIPLDRLATICGRKEWTEPASRLKHTALRLVGAALSGQPDDAMRSRLCMYFPDADTLFYRIVNMSLLSPHNVPEPGRQWSLLAEISEPGRRDEETERRRDEVRAIDRTIRDLLCHGLIESREQVLGTWHHRVEYAQPTPTLDRDATLHALQPLLMSAGIWSRGRFGAWLYEAGNMDHSFMQGFEAAAHLLDGSPELTVWHPLVVNRPHPAIGWDRVGIGVDRRGLVAPARIGDDAGKWQASRTPRRARAETT